MAIFPIVKGQKWDAKHVIPPRASIRPADSAEGKPTNVGDKPLTLPASVQEHAGSAAPKANPPIDPSHASTVEIQEMLSRTGSQAQKGHVVDFHSDVRRDTKNGLPSVLRRTSTEDSNEEFVDAQG